MARKAETFTTLEEAKERWPELPIGRAKDITGNKYNRLTPIYRAQKGQFQSVFWVSKCDCGKYCITEAGKVVSGHTKSCGCYDKESTAALSKKDLKGQKFGRLTVLEETNERNNSYIIWLCRCECGNYTKVASHSLISGNTKSCGCYNTEILQNRAIDLIGERFGKLEVIEKLDERNKKAIVWKCKCDCGNVVNVRGDSLRNGLTKSCGCLKSIGEFTISQILIKNNIPFIKEKTFEDFRFKDTNVLARYDFYIENNNTNYIIEYDGSQHFIVSGWNTVEHFDKVQSHDTLKNQYCKDNNIPLIRIPYTHLKDLCLEDLLLETTTFRVV